LSITIGRPDRIRRRDQKKKALLEPEGFDKYRLSDDARQTVLF
jgi:hypothetical protein